MKDTHFNPFLGGVHIQWQSKECAVPFNKFTWVNEVLDDAATHDAETEKTEAQVWRLDVFVGEDLWRAGVDVIKLFSFITDDEA